MSDIRDLCPCGTYLAADGHPPGETCPDPAIPAHVVDHGAEGDHWATMRPVDDYLREQLASLGACSRIAEGNGSRADYALLDLIHVWESDHSPSDTAYEWTYGALLDAATATWDDRDALPDTTQPRPLCRVELVFGTGGPHVELVGIYNRAGDVVRVEAHQFWSGHREAWTEHPRALSTFSQFVTTFIVAEA